MKLNEIAFVAILISFKAKINYLKQYKYLHEIKSFYFLCKF